MSFTKILSPGIDTTSSYTIQELNSTGIATASTFVGPNGLDVNIGVDGGNFIVGGASTTVVVNGNVNTTGTISASTFVGDGSGITGVTASGTGIAIKDNSITVGVAGTIDFGTNLNVSPASAGIVTITTGDSDFTINDKIVHTGDTNTAIRFPADDTVTIETAGSERVRVSSAGNVGIGTVDPQDILHISHSIPVISLTDADNNLTSKINAASGNLYFDTAASTRFHIFRANTTELVRITGDGDVGIGTNSPAYNLDLGESPSTIRLVSESNGTAIRIGAGSNGNNQVTLLRVDGGNPNHKGTTNNSAYGFSVKYMGDRFGNRNSLSIFGDNQTGTQVEAITINQDGSTGIGTDNPTAKLDVNGTLNVTGVSTFQDNIHLGDNDKINLGDNDDLQLYHDGSHSWIWEQGPGNFYIRSNGGSINLRLNSTDMVVVNENSSVDLYYGSSKKFETTTTGVEVFNGASTSATIAGPDEIIIDPATVGDNTGSVRIKGDLYVDGTTTQINSTTIELADFIVGIATTATTDTLADGAGIQIGPDNTFLYEYNSGTNPSLKSSENLNVATGKHYQIGETEVLNATTLGSGVVNSSLTSVGTLTGLTVSGDISIADKIIHTGDTNTAIRFPANDTFTVETAGQERIRVDSSGRLGIGTDNPTNMLDIAGSTPTIELNDTDTGVIHRINANSGAGIWYFDNDINNVGSDGSFVFRHGHLSGGGTVLTITSIGTLTLGSDSGTIRRSGDTDTYINFNGSDAIRFIAGNSERLRVNTSGIDVTGHTETDTLNVSGISTFGGALDINNGVDISGDISIADKIIHTGDTNTSIRFPAADTFTVETAGNERMRINSAGQVGIGTDNPQAKLDVAGFAIVRAGDGRPDRIRISIQSDANYLTSFCDPSDPKDLVIENNNTTRDISFYTGGTNSLQIDSSGNVGIGTDNPNNNSKLHIYDGSAGCDLTITSGNVNAVDINLGDIDDHDIGRIRYNNSSNAMLFNTNGSERVRIDSSGNVGIGTDNPQHQINTYGNSNSGGILVQNALYASNVNRPYLIAGTQNHDGTTANWGKFGFQHRIKSNSGGNGRVTIDTLNGEAFCVSNNNNIGIGTDNPTELLHLSADGAHEILLKRGGGSPSEVRFANQGNTALISNNTNGIAFETGATPSEAMRIKSNGKVGIGTDNPDGRLEVRAPDATQTLNLVATENVPDVGGSIHFYAADRSDAGEATAYIKSLLVNNEGGSGNVQRGDLAFGTQNAERMRINEDGKVGIGTDSPSKNLEIANAGSAAVIKLIRTDAGNPGEFEIISGGNRNIISSFGVKDLSINTDQTERIRIMGTGNVGIGVITADVKLDVNGEIRASTGVLFGTDTAAANTLDDYEEGTWTPVFAGDGGTLGSYTYAAQSGTYTKVGNLVTAICYLQDITQVSGGNGKAEVTGLPFTNGDSYPAIGPVTLSSFAVAASATSAISAQVNSGGTGVKFRRTRESAAANLVDEADMTSGSADIYFSITYRVA